MTINRKKIKRLTITIIIIDAILIASAYLVLFT